MPRFPKTSCRFTAPFPKKHWPMPRSGFAESSRRPRPSGAQTTADSIGSSGDSETTWGGPACHADTSNSMIYRGESHLEMDDDWGYPYLRKPYKMSIFDVQVPKKQ